MVPRNTLMAELSALGQIIEAELDIGNTALTLAALENPEKQRGPYQRHLKKLVEDVTSYVIGHRDPVPLELRHEALTRIIYERYGYVGTEDCFDSIEAANLMHVIDSRSGLPVALGVLYLHVATHLGWTASGVDFPGRFLLCLDGKEGRLIFDAFEGGRTLDASDLRKLLKSMSGPDAELNPAHYRKASSRAVLLRLQNNIKVRLLNAQRFSAALNILETMVALAPEDGVLWREIGILNARLDQVPAAVAALEECLRHSASERALFQASTLLQELRGRPH